MRISDWSSDVCASDLTICMAAFCPTSCANCWPPDRPDSFHPESLARPTERQGFPLSPARPLGRGQRYTSLSLHLPSFCRVCLPPHHPTTDVLPRASSPLRKRFPDPAAGPKTFT